MLQNHLAFYFVSSIIKHCFGYNTLQAVAASVRLRTSDVTHYLVMQVRGYLTFAGLELI